MNPTDKNKNNKQKLSQLMDGEWHGLDPADCVDALCSDKTLHAKWSRYHIIRDVMNNESVQSDAALAERICSAIHDEPAYTNITPFSGASIASAGKSATPELAEQPTSFEAQTESAAVSSMQSNAAGLSADKSGWVNTGVAGFAVAASVALVTVVGLNLVQQEDHPTAVLQTFATAEDIDSDANAEVGPAIVADVDASNQFNSFDPTALPTVELVSNSGPFWMSPESLTRVTDERRLNMMLSHHIENSPTAGREGIFPYSRLVGYEASAQGQ